MKRTPYGYDKEVFVHADPAKIAKVIRSQARQRLAVAEVFNEPNPSSYYLVTDCHSRGGMIFGTAQGYARPVPWGTVKFITAEESAKQFPLPAKPKKARGSR